MQMQSDFSQVEVSRSSNPEATAAGAAYLAGLAVGFFKDRSEIKSLLSEGKRFVPQMSEAESAEKLRGWRGAVKACRAFSEQVQ